MARRDLTLAVKRTIVRPRPDAEKVILQVPAFSHRQRWIKANETLKKRGHGRGKHGKRRL